MKDFDLIANYRDRVTVCLSLTGTPDKEAVIQVIEPHASPISERLAALKEAHRLGLRTYGMLCPLLPGIADDPKQIDWLIRYVASVRCGRSVFRGRQSTGRFADRDREHPAASRVRGWRPTRLPRFGGERIGRPMRLRLIASLQSAMKRHMTTSQLRVLLYPTNLTPEDEARIRKDDAGVVWL